MPNYNNIEFELIKQDLKRFEILLKQYLDSQNDFLNTISLHLINAGGKRLRPALAILCSKINSSNYKEPASESVLKCGICVELVHLASLYHDDVIDEAQERRSVETVNYRWGNLVAIVAGDYLLALAASLAASLGGEVAKILADTLAQLCKGQLLEVQKSFDVKRSINEYLESISGKTAALLASSCRLGAKFSGLDDAAGEILYEFGKSFGIAFQIRDDVQDIIGTKEKLLKEPGQDLKEGIYTLPTIFAFELDATSRVRDLLGHKLTATEFEEVRNLIVSTGAISKALEVAREYADNAKSLLKEFPESPISKSLGNLIDSLLKDFELKKIA